MLTLDDRFGAIVADGMPEAKMRPYQEPDPVAPAPAYPEPDPVAPVPAEEPRQGMPVEEVPKEEK
ncbi:hypothetical protein PWG71_24080 [Nocardiopsis sp. N85]|uniref:hypothetical protein n=1 Tax=Nocardiopsis sp. N85 TaxID=3029400 RepID=UPI00237FAFE4|nr:hypothetical protein [Nocardiopsis sp. N85]MDE3724482.1 hypothetical protein [Nocardiopsis sp. N85]